MKRKAIIECCRVRKAVGASTQLPMKLGALCVVLAGLILAACSSVDVKVTTPEAALRQQMMHLVDNYNSIYGAHYPMPQLRVEIFSNSPTVIAAADYSDWAVLVNQTWVDKNLCLVSKEALPHELAHLFVYYDQYGPPQTVMFSAAHGAEMVALNGPPLLQDTMDEHGPAWQVKARALGAHPCKEGYCRTKHPYRRFPLQCTGQDRKQVLDSKIS
jgi:hypothetical protein